MRTSWSNEFLACKTRNWLACRTGSLFFTIFREHAERYLPALASHASRAPKKLAKINCLFCRLGSDGPLYGSLTCQLFHPANGLGQMLIIYSRTFAWYIDWSAKKTFFEVSNPFGIYKSDLFLLLSDNARVLIEREAKQWWLRNSFTFDVFGQVLAVYTVYTVPIFRASKKKEKSVWKVGMFDEQSAVTLKCVHWGKEITWCSRNRDSVSHFMVEIFWQPLSSLYITTASTLI